MRNGAHWETLASLMLIKELDIRDETLPQRSVVRGRYSPCGCEPTCRVSPSKFETHNSLICATGITFAAFSCEGEYPKGMVHLERSSYGRRSDIARKQLSIGALYIRLFHLRNGTPVLAICVEGEA
jgi:hypothetical protein